MNKKPVREFKELTIEKMIDYAEQHLQQVEQWKASDHPGFASHVYEYSCKAEAVIEMLEWRLHGHHGAVDKEHHQPYTPKLRPRLNWIRKAAGMKPKGKEQ